ncbi:MAG: hypothetical protein EOO85_19060 [Pedobacter sp.]|nr:MAG: hypothetical protein EOO85_19060 [Pedobacter sp.]
MLRKFTYLCCLIFFANQSKAQQYGLFNTKTLFDGFENTAQKTFVLDYSRQYASNFFLPNLTINANTDGNDQLFRLLARTGLSTTKDSLSQNKYLNMLLQSPNIYLFNYKIFKSYKYHKELGFSWQLRTDVEFNYNKESLDILDNYKTNPNFINIPLANSFNSFDRVQSYHQFSLSYRENYNKKLAFGAKVSVLSGVLYNSLNLDNTSFIFNQAEDKITMELQGDFRTSFVEGSKLSNKLFIPTFKNPGLAISLGTTYTAKSGVFIMANLKDLGFIRWNETSFQQFDTPVPISLAAGREVSHIENRIAAAVANPGDDNRSFYSPTNARADFLVSKPYGNFTPSLVLSKNVFFKGGDATLVNRFNFNNFSASISPSYNLAKLFMVGAQGMYQTPNFEAYLGTNNVFNTSSHAKINKHNGTIGTGYNSLAVYAGIGIKFGYFVEHPQNSSYMPGLDEEETSFFKRLFSIFSRKK